MTGIARTDTSLLGQWWWTVDRWTLAALAALMGFGVILILAATPPVAERIGLGSFHLAQRHLALLPLALLVLFLVSLLTPRWVRRVAVIGFAAALLLCALTLWIGPEIKGATRWISVAGVSLQPSEFVKPTFAVVVAWMFALSKKDPSFEGAWIAAGPRSGAFSSSSLVFRSSGSAFWRRRPSPAWPPATTPCRTSPNGSTASSTPPPAISIRSSAPLRPS
jgi:cell division protein FtsW